MNLAMSLFVLFCFALSVFASAVSFETSTCTSTSTPTLSCEANGHSGDKNVENCNGYSREDALRWASTWLLKKSSDADEKTALFAANLWLGSPGSGEKSACVGGRIKTILNATLPYSLVDDLEQEECAGVASDDATRISLPSALERAAHQTFERDKDSVDVFVMLNGMNEGIFVTILRKRIACIKSLATAAARALHVGEELLQKPMYFFSVIGEVVRSPADLKAAGYIVHLLFYSQTWVWPGVQPDFEWRVDSVRMRTLSITPKVILVSNLLTKQQCGELIAAGNAPIPSPEAHYSDEFKNYRTSQTGDFWGTSNPGIVQFIRRQTHEVARLPSVSYVEHPQLLKYTGNQRYRLHQDYFFDMALPPLDRDNVRNPVRVGALIWLEAWFKWLRKRYECLSDSRCALNRLGVSRDDARWLLASLQERDLIPPSHGVNIEFQMKLAHHVRDLLKYSASRALAHYMRVASDIDEAYDPGVIAEVGMSFPEILEGLPKMYSTVLGDAKNVFVPSRDESNSFSERANRVAASIAPSAVPSGHANRLLTLLYYINEVPEGAGGETSFPFASGPGVRRTDRMHDITECAGGVMVPPQIGSAVLFYHQLGDGQLDSSSQHAGCPLDSGVVKWAINSFVWSTPSRYGEALIS